MNSVEVAIIKVLKQGTPLRARKIARAVGVTRQEVNRYLYSSLKDLVMKDSNHRWQLKGKEENQLVLPIEIDNENSHLEKLLKLHESQNRKKMLENTLKSLTDSSAE